MIHRQRDAFKTRHRVAVAGASWNARAGGGGVEGGRQECFYACIGASKRPIPARATQYVILKTKIISQPQGLDIRHPELVPRPPRAKHRYCRHIANPSPVSPNNLPFLPPRAKTFKPDLSRFRSRRRRSRTMGRPRPRPNLLHRRLHVSSKYCTKRHPR